METLVAGVIGFTSIIMLLVFIILAAKKILVGSGEVLVTIGNDKERSFISSAGDSLLNILNEQQIDIASSCGGKGTCGLCKVSVLQGGGGITPAELDVISRKDANNRVRLACQVKVKQAISILLPEESLVVKHWECRVVSNKNVASFIKELTVEIPSESAIEFNPGGYLQLECPSYQLDFNDLIIDAPYNRRWLESNLFRYRVNSSQSIRRSYSPANFSSEFDSQIKFNVRIALPPKDNPNAPPGIVSSYLFSLVAGSKIKLIGPFGKLHVHESGAEMLFIGGGVGMAPMRSMIFNQLKNLKSKRKISYWYGAKSFCEVYYQAEFELLADEFSNFEWTLALSSPQPEDNWQGLDGHIHKVVLQEYLANHQEPEEIDYYLCGPPPMIDACLGMLDELGVDTDNIFMEKFG
jgi:Na+-transporting NADH:ubiquinone oxidoreductase subunit F